MTTKRFPFAQLAATAVLLTLACAAVGGGDRWTPEETEALRALWIGELGPVPADPSNRFADDLEAARLGERIFFDSAFSADGSVSCGTCHVADREFQDGVALDVLEQVIASEPEGYQELSINIDTGGLAARRMLKKLCEKP